MDTSFHLPGPRARLLHNLPWEVIMATTVGRFTIWSIVALVALVVLALVLAAR